MIQALKYLQLTASTLAACLVISACGGGAAEAPPSSTPNNSIPSGNSPTTSTPSSNSPTTSTPSGTSLTVVADTAPPTLTITDSVTAATATGPVTFTFTFSEDVGTSFTAADVTITGATAGALTKVDTTRYTMVATPPANTTGTINISAAIGTFSDLAFNLNTAAAAASQAYNTVPTGGTGTCLAASCIDFSGAITFGLFENVDGTVALANDPKDTTNKVAKFVKTPTDKDYFGTTILGGPASVVLTATNKTVTMRVLSPAVGTNMLLKFEGGAGGATTEIDVATTKANEWETLSFVLPAAGTFTTVVLFPNGRSLVTANKEIYVDEIKFPVAAAITPPVVVTTPLKWASGYAAGKSVEGGDFGNFVDFAAPTEYADGGASPIDAGDPNFYFGFGFNDATKKANYMGAFVKAPGNGNVNLGAYTTLNFYSWGNAEWMNLAPTFTVILQGAPKPGGCGSNSGASEVKLTFVSNSGTAKLYALPLANATVNFACNGETTAAAILTAGISQFNVIADGSANINFTTKVGTAWPSFMNVGKITFN